MDWQIKNTGMCTFHIWIQDDHYFAKTFISNKLTARWIMQTKQVVSATLCLSCLTVNQLALCLEWEGLGKWNVRRLELNLFRSEENGWCFVQDIFKGIFPTQLSGILLRDHSNAVPNSNVHGTNMGPIWGHQGPGGHHVGPMNFAIWGICCPIDDKPMLFERMAFSMKALLLSIKPLPQIMLIYDVIWHHLMTVLIKK